MIEDMRKLLQSGWRPPSLQNPMFEGRLTGARRDECS